MTPMSQSMSKARRRCVLAAAALSIGLSALIMVSPVHAVPKGPGGQTCKSSGTTTVNGTEEGTGRAMKCTADFCKYDECETSGPNIGKCYEKTSYSNIRDCKAAAKTMTPGLRIPQGYLAPLKVQPSQPPVQREPIPPMGGVMKRGVEGEEPTSTEKEGK